MTIYVSGDNTSCNEGLVACPHGDGTYRCVDDTVGCGKLYIFVELGGVKCKMYVFTLNLIHVQLL